MNLRTILISRFQIHLEKKLIKVFLKRRFILEIVSYSQIGNIGNNENTKNLNLIYGFGEYKAEKREKKLRLFQETLLGLLLTIDFLFEEKINR